MKKRMDKTQLQTLTGTAVFTALVIVLQMSAGLISFGGVNLNFVLIPIVVCAVMFGKTAGIVAGSAFGIVTFFQAMTGAQGEFGLLLYSINPFFGFIITAVRGMLLGAALSLIYYGLKKTKLKSYAIYLITAVSAPIINTGIFILLAATLYKSAMMDMAGDTGFLYFLFIGLTGINFVVEFLTTAALTPPILIGLASAQKAHKTCKKQ